MEKKLKAFRIDKGINSMFMDACRDLNINQSDVIELLVIRWLQLRKKLDKRSAKIYDEI
jgi:antitoxin component of RelBE/YafQ-DinJ toxin-antitoxin module